MLMRGLAYGEFHCKHLKKKKILYKISKISLKKKAKSLSLCNKIILCSWSLFFYSEKNYVGIHFIGNQNHLFEEFFFFFYEKKVIYCVLPEKQKKFSFALHKCTLKRNVCSPFLDRLKNLFPS